MAEMLKLDNIHKTFNPGTINEKVALNGQKIDLEFMEWLGENGVPFSIIFTKADKLTNGKVKDNVNKYLKKLTEQWEELPPHFVSSSEKKTGRQEILDYIDSINRSLKA